MLINCDLKQIEVCIFAQLAQEQTLIDLLNNGKDVHKYIGSQVYNKTEVEVTSEERTNIKAGTFGIIYGNGPKKLSETTGRSLEWSKEFIINFYKMFPNAKIWHTDILREVQQTGKLRLFTGHTLQFKKYPAKYEWQIKQGIIESYNPPDIKNWPVQHTAFIIMAIFIGQFYKNYANKNRDKYILINTVHDSLMLDCQEDYVDECLEDLQESIDEVPNIVYNKFNYRFVVPIKMDISIGYNWSDL